MRYFKLFVLLFIVLTFAGPSFAKKRSSLTQRPLPDSGAPTVVSDPDSAAANDYRKAARLMAASLATKGKDYTSKFGKIVVEGNS
mgnify:CR=1 FL=1